LQIHCDGGGAGGFLRKAFSTASKPAKTPRLENQMHRFWKFLLNSDFKFTACGNFLSPRNPNAPSADFSCLLENQIDVKCSQPVNSKFKSPGNFPNR
jgi:hypothetical protein